MKKTLMVVAVWIMFSSSSLACSLCIELEKKGFSPAVVSRAVSGHFGGGLKVAGSGKPFSSSDSDLFNVAIGKDGKVYPVTKTRQLRGLVFDGSIGARPAKIFVINGIDYVGIKNDRTIPVLLAHKKQATAPSKTATKTPVIITENKASFKYSDEAIQVPPDNEKR